MLYKLPKEKKHLSKDTLMDRVHKLPEDKKSEWYDKYDSYTVNIILYEKLLRDVSEGNIRPDIIQDKKYLETEIPRQENELFRMLSTGEDETDEEKIVDMVSILIGQGCPNIRPGKGDYSITKIANFATK